MRNRLILALIIAMMLICPKAFASDLVEIAMGELGKGETIADNDGPDVLEYTKGLRVSWCAAFVSYALDKSGSNPFGFTLSARAMLNKGKELGLVRKTPQKGRIAVWSRGPGKGHVGIVISCGKDGSFRTIEGNSGEFPAKVKIRYHKPGEKNLLAFLEVK